MIRDIVEAQVREGHRLWIRFEDGVEGEVDIAGLVPFEGVFAPLRDPAAFRTVRVEPDLGTVCWPSGADLDPIVLYSIVTGAALPGRNRAGAAE